MKAYINGIGSVSPQENIFQEGFQFDVSADVLPFLQIARPDYKAYINPKQLRRMSKVVRMAIVAAQVAMKDAGIEQPDSIITGTGMGCQSDTEKFLNAMLDNDEGLLNPTAFIQSTHNTMGAQIALLLGNHNYNFTYVHRTFSFESTLLDALMQLEENKAHQILVGGIDEITQESWKIKAKIGFYKEHPIGDVPLLEDKQRGAMAGEGTAFFVLSNEKTASTYASLEAVDTFIHPEDAHETTAHFQRFMTNNQLKYEDVDLLIMGNNGDQAFDQHYHQLEQALFAETPIAYFKHICGEYDTASSYAMWLAAEALKAQRIPEFLMKKGPSPQKLKTILIYNQFRNINHSLILLKA